jgi:hypothetical protein
MSDRAEFSALSDMEDDILAVGRWAGVLSHIGTATSQIEPAEIWVISKVLTQLGACLEANWQKAFLEAGGRP